MNKSTHTEAGQGSAPLPWGEAPYSIKQHGLTLQNCDSEPVQTPGCIQDHGALLTLRAADFSILQASDNTERHLGMAARLLLGQPVAHVIGRDNAACLRAMLVAEKMQGNAVPAFRLMAQDGRPAMDASVHLSGAALVLELEPVLPTSTSSDRDLFTSLGGAVTRLQSTQGLQPFCQRLTEEVRKLTALDRVMVYRFHADLHGEVFAESHREGLPSWLGLHYPEADIPKPARDIFKRTWIRPLPDAAGPLSEMLPLANPDTGKPLDMTHCALRGASVMYTEYLTNMGAAASLTMSILVEGELWGLIACQHQTPTHFSPHARQACELMAQVASLQIKSAERNEQLAYRLRLESLHQQLVAQASLDGDLTTLVDRHPGLIDAIAADGVALFHLDRWWCAGLTPTPEQLAELANWLDQRPELDSVARPVFFTDALSSLYPGGAELVSVASGVLAMRISRLRRDMLVWFRPQSIQTIHWAGQPQEVHKPAGPHGARLTPRRSFELFVESVRHRALPWTETEVEAALQLRLMVMELVVARAERLSDLNMDLTRSNEELDAFAYVASHDLKEPLRGIHRYAHQLLESAQSLDSSNRQRLANLMRLTVRMDSLLDSLLHFSRVGRTNLDLEAVDLDEVLDEALEMVSTRSADNAAVIQRPRPLPTVLCDRVRVREVFSNLLSNALKYSRADAPQIEIGFIAQGERPAWCGADVALAGEHDPVVFYVRDQGIGIEARHFEPIFRIFKRLHALTEYGGGVGAGLAIVQKVVQRHDGRVWLSSALGVGSTFFFTLAAPDASRPRSQ